MSLITILRPRRSPSTFDSILPYPLQRLSSQKGPLNLPMARKSGRGRTAALARRHNTSMRRGNTGSTEYIDHKTATNTKNLSNTYGSQGTNCTGTPIETSTIPSGMKEEDQNRRTERDRLQRFDNERIDSVKSSFSQEANYDGCDDGPDFSDEGYNSPGSASSQACWHRSLTWWKE